MSSIERVSARGKFLFEGDRKLYLKGVTYGPFAPDEAGSEYGSPDRAARDLAQMASVGVNAIRVYTPPPRWLLDHAAERRIRVLVGLPWEQHVTFLDNRKTARSIVRGVTRSVRELAGHPALLGYAVGNEIPGPIVRWHGAERTERFIRELYEAAKAEDPEALVTYVNYPTTEYLELPFLDFASFNVYLESRELLDRYLARVQNLTGDRPLVMGEIGLDSRRNGEEGQADSLRWQVRSAYRAGAAGAFVFSWTDEWHRGGHDIDDWDFGLTRRDRTPKPSLDSVTEVFRETPFAHDRPWPRISVVVCSYGGHATIEQTLDGLRALEYPDFEVMVIDDGSPEPLEPLVAPYDVRYIRTANQGLSVARTLGMVEATGEIVAYIDDDAWPDPHWLQYLAHAFMTDDWVGVGGPNIPPLSSGFTADCIAHSPGGPIHVLYDDREAEHIPGCNMAFRRSALIQVGGFDGRFTSAGDDVDLCWRLQQRGGRIGYAPAAMVWHHRRDTALGYLRQQRGYGRAEAMLEKKWPEKYNALGHIPWAGRIYAEYLTRMFAGRRNRIYHGVWGSAFFQRVYSPIQDGLRSALSIPEWYLMIGVGLALAPLGMLWWPVYGLGVLAGLAILAIGVQAWLSISDVRFPSRPRGWWARTARRVATVGLHMAQPLARLYGRTREGLTPWRRGAHGMLWSFKRMESIWSESWMSAEDRLAAMESFLRESRMVVLAGGPYDTWDLDVRGGVLGSARVRLVVEEHGSGRQLIRVKSWIRTSLKFRIGTLVAIVLSVGLASLEYPNAALVVAAVTAISVMRAVLEGGFAMAAVRTAVLTTQTQAESTEPIDAEIGRPSIEHEVEGRTFGALADSA